MLNITILSIGGVKEKYYKDAIEEYTKRLSPYVKLKFQELKAEKFSEHNKSQARQTETLRLLSFLEKHHESDIFLLDESGREFDTPEFSDFLRQMDDGGGKKIIFVIAGSLGYDREIIPSDIHRLSLSRLTMLHELAKVVLLEQLYRGVSIIRGKSYHH